MYTFGEKAALAAGGQFPAAGTDEGLRAAILQYAAGALQAGLGVQSHRENLTAGGEAEQRIYVAGARYNHFEDRLSIAGTWWRHRNERTNTATAITTGWNVGASWRVTQLVSFVAQAGRARDNGRVYVTGAPKAEGTDTYLSFGANYEFSRRTAVYARFGRISDEGNGFNGRAAVAATVTRDAAPLVADGSVHGAFVGLRHRF
jgi:predicted porin